MKERSTVTWVQVNFCNGETVQLTGQLREDTKVKDSRAEQRLKAPLTGAGDLGNECELDLDVESNWDTATMTMTLRDRYALKTKGPAPDQRVTVSRQDALSNGRTCANDWSWSGAPPRLMPSPSSAGSLSSTRCARYLMAPLPCTCEWRW